MEYALKPLFPLKKLKDRTIEDFEQLETSILNELEEEKSIDNDDFYCKYIDKRNKSNISETDYPLSPKLDVLPSAVIKASFDLQIPVYRFCWQDFKPEYLNKLPKPKYAISTFSYSLSNRMDKKRSNPVNELSNRWNFPVEWFGECMKYLSSLSEEDKITLSSYSLKGDQIANKYLINKDDFNSYFTKIIINLERVDFEDRETYYNSIFFPLFFVIKNTLLDEYKTGFQNILQYTDDKEKLKEEVLDKISLNLDNKELYIIITRNRELFNLDFYHLMTEKYINRLKNIINNSPPLPEEGFVFRGVRDKYYYKDKDQKDYYNTTFMSTSYNMDKAFRFSNWVNECCIKKIILPKGSKAIFMESVSQVTGEQEILLSPDTEFNIISEEFVEYSLPSKISKKFEENICERDYRKITMTTLKLVL